SEGASAPVQFPAPAAPVRGKAIAGATLTPVAVAAPVAAPPAAPPSAVINGGATLAAPVATSGRGAIATKFAPPPAPTGVSVTGTPASATVRWQAVPGVASYVLARKEPNVPTQQATLAATAVSWVDVGLRPGVTYTYMVDAIYPNGRDAYTEVPFSPPPAVNPSVFQARQVGNGQVQLTWQAVGGVSYYVVLGPGSSNGGVKVSTTSYTVTGAPTGLQTWLVGSYYDPGPAGAPGSVGPNAISTAATAFPKVQLTVTPPPPVPVTTAKRTTFDPMMHGFRFINTFKNSFIGPPIGMVTSGLCGGMSYAVLDYFNTGRQIPIQDYRPANNTTIQQYLYGRQVTSLMQNLDKWGETSVNPFGSRTTEFFNWGINERLRELMSFIDRGVPVPLGLKGTGAGLDHDHQVLAVGYDLGRYKLDLGNFKTDVKIYIFDPNYPTKTLTFVPNPAGFEYYEVEHPANRWRTYFVDGRYASMTPPNVVTQVYPNDGLAHELLFEFDTGADDMRGGADHVDVTIKLTNNTSQYYPNISQNGIWLANYLETAQVVLSQPIPTAMIKTIEITTNATGGLNGDNWDMKSVQVYAVGSAPAQALLNSRAGPYRFTGARVPLVVTVH
ncbi:MAG: fibronectin type III domain-containing protein, partial [Gemmatimonadota bacterium]